MRSSCAPANRLRDARLGQGELRGKPSVGAILHVLRAMADRERPALRPSHVSHPILRLELLSNGGAHTLSERVFCRQRGQSWLVADCVDCERCEGIRRGAVECVDCDVSLPAAQSAPDTRGEHTEVGALLSTGVAVVDQSASMDEALALMNASGRQSLAVVDEDQRLVGILHELTFVPAPVDGARRREEESVACAMSSAVVVEETMPVRAALHLLASSHLREAIVVTPEGKPLGVFRDLEGLRWLAHARGR